MTVVGAPFSKLQQVVQAELSHGQQSSLPRQLAGQPQGASQHMLHHESQHAAGYRPRHESQRAAAHRPQHKSQRPGSEQPQAKVQGVLFDLGVSSPQLETAARGFSFRQDGPLDMRMNPARGESAAVWLNRVTERELARGAEVLW